MTPITQCCKAPHTLQTPSDHPSLLEIIHDNIIVIMLHYRRKKNPQNLQKSAPCCNSETSFGLYYRKKKNQPEKETQSWVLKTQLFLYLKFLMGEAEDTPFDLCQ